MAQIDYEDLRIKLSRFPRLFVDYPQLESVENISPEELKIIIDKLIDHFDLNPLMEGIDLNNTDLEEANFNGATLDGMNLSGKNLNRAKFNFANMRNVILSTAEEPMEHSMTEAHFSFADMTGVQAVAVDLEGGEFMGTNLTGANLSHARLSDAMFDQTNLTNANLTGADLRGVDMTDVASWQGTNLQDIHYDIMAQFPRYMTGVVNLPEDLEVDEDDDDEMMHDGDHEAIAFEIHNIFKKIDIDGYQKIIAENVTAGPILSIDEIVFLFKHIIVTVFDEKEAGSSVQKLEAVLTRLKNSHELEESGLKKLVSDTAKFVNAQSKEFQDFYMHAFIQDCYHAYTSNEGRTLENGEGMSCTKGIVERFIWIVGDSVQAMCTDGCTNPVYEKLLDVFGKRKLDKNELTQEWNEQFLETAAFQNKDTMTKEQVKQSYLDFMKQKYSAVGLWVPHTQRMVEEEADKLDYAFESRMFGGRRNKKRKYSQKKGRNATKVNKKTGGGRTAKSQKKNKGKTQKRRPKKNQTSKK